MKIIGMVCILNEEELIEDFFEHNLPLVDKMIIAEGGVIGHPFKTNSGRSIDKTNYFLDKWKAMYPDKIKIIRKDRPWNSKQEQQNSMLKYAKEGDWIWIMAADELYLQGTRKKLEKIVGRDQSKTEISFPMVHYFGDTKRMIIDKTFKSSTILQRHQRFFKYQSGMFYINHPTINDGQNRDVFQNEFYSDKKLVLGMNDNYSVYKYRRDLMGTWDYDYSNTVWTFHYGFCRNILSQVRKHIYYLMRDRGMRFEDAIEFLMDKTNNDIDVIFGYIEQIHQKPDVAVVNIISDDDHPLKNKIWKNSEVDFNKILKKYRNFEEKPSK